MNFSMKNKNFINHGLKLLDKNHKKKLVLIIILFLIGSILEIFSIGLIIPLTSVLLDFDSEIILNLKNYLLGYFPNLTDNKFFLICMLSFVGFYIFKILFLNFLLFIRLKFIFDLRQKLANKLYSKYLDKPFSFYLNTNSSKLLLNCNTEVDNYCYNYLNSTLEFLVEVFIILGFLTLIAILNTKIFIFLVIFFGIIFFIYQKFLKKRTIRWGKERIETSRMMSKNLLESFGSIKEILINYKQKFFTDIFNRELKNNSVVTLRQFFFSDFPRHLIELIAIILFVGFLLVIFLKDGNITRYVPLIGVYAAIAFKMMPSSNRILSALQRIRFSTKSIDIISDEISNEESAISLTDNKIINDKNFEILNIKNLSYKYPGNYNSLLENLNLTINKGEFVGIVGESGVGKSTLINIISTLDQTYSGEIFINNFNIKDVSFYWRNKIGFVPQQPFILDDTIEKNLAFGENIENINKNLLLKICDVCEISDKIKSLQDGLQTKIGERGVKFSGGQLQRLSIARAMYKRPEILIFDEATNALDPIKEEKIIKNILNFKKDNITIIMISHKSSLIDFASKVYELKDKKLNLISK